MHRRAQSVIVARSSEEVTRTVFLKRIQIKNIRSIAELDLDFGGENHRTRKWTLLLGENGTGKSTILRCIALLLCGRDALPDLLGRNPTDWIRFGCKKAHIKGVVGNTKGSERKIALKLKWGDTISETLDHNVEGLAPLEKAFKHNKRHYFLAGYGVSRRLSHAGIIQSVHDRAGAVRTLFDPDATLLPLASWAMDLHYTGGERSLDLIKETLGALLPADVKFLHIDKRRKALIFETADGHVSLADLSDGFQNMAAWAGDLLYRTTGAPFARRSNPLATRGLLLLDEIDLHLHVKWQRRLRRFLGKSLPEFQIVATTHSPVTAQQSGPGEIHVLTRPARKEPPMLRCYEDVPHRLGLHQLVEPFFGVDTVDSEYLATLKNEYRELAARERRSEDDERRLEGLREQLADAPEWNDGPEAREQTRVLRSIQALLEEGGGGPSRPPAGKTRMGMSKRRGGTA